MRIGIIGPSKLKKGTEEIIKRLAKIVAESENEIVVTPDKGSSSEYFAQEYLENGGKKVFEVLPLDDTEFGYKEWVNTELGEAINCGIWRNQPEKLNEETDILLCVGYAAGVLAEITYSKWFKPKPVYIITNIEKEKLPRVINESLDIRYVSVKEFEGEI